ncbi:hypothetical protein V6N12_035145 [Hibiscus sabdariffa]|uniref:F-box domain-containing protein n=1 Tax=Hibiscus sabdariffa TaxID=183260 RepID=A0ABR2ALQ0_9ROSI
MLSFHIDIVPKSFSTNCVEKIDNNSHNMLSISNVTPSSLSHSYNTWIFRVRRTSFIRTFTFFAISRKFSSDSNSDPYPDIPGPESCLKSKSESETGKKDQKSVVSHNIITKTKNLVDDKKSATTIPKNTRRGCRSDTKGNSFPDIFIAILCFSFKCSMLRLLETHSWKTSKELEKAIQVYQNAKDRLPHRAVKLDISIERDLAYGLKVRECPQVLFLRGNRIVYTERGKPQASSLLKMMETYTRRGEVDSVKHEQEHDDNLIDRISGLPEDLLVRILCLLSLKEALQTCVLSRKWRDLCLFFSGSLNFGASKTLMSDPKKLLKERDGFVASITRFLNLHRAGTIDELRVCFDLNLQHRRSIEEWIEIALTKKVKSLELDLEPCRTNHRRGSGNYRFGWKFFKSSGIRFLISLCLKHVDVSGQILESFLSNCPLLETLHVSHTKQLTHINVCGSSLRLKHLHISFCKCIKSIEVYATNLVTFEYRGSRCVNIDLKCVPQLCDVSYNGQWESIRVFHLYEPVPSFLPTSQLVNLSLHISYLPLMLYAVEAHRLIDEKYFQSIIKEGHRLSLEHEKHMMLREVEIVGFVGAAGDNVLVYFLSLIAPNLDSIVINRCLPRWCCGAPINKRKIKVLEDARMFAYDMLSANRPKGAKFLLL